MAASVSHSTPSDVLNLQPCDSAQEARFSKYITATASSCLRKTIETIHWVIENRGGLAFLWSSVLVPSQYMCPNAQISNNIIDHTVKSNQIALEKFNLSTNGRSIGGVIVYPPNWNRNDRSRCIVYHNGNGTSVSDFFKSGSFEGPPAQMIKSAQCPVILYDYRGTGLSSGNPKSSKFYPTYASIVDDGESLLRLSLESFEKITILGSSLGGAVATASLARHLNCKIPSSSPHFLAPGRVRLINHDSFTTSTSVAFPNWPTISSWIGWMLGVLVDAATPMKSLINRNIPITILCHQNDPVIPFGARMANYIGTLPKNPNVSIMYSPEYGHANLSRDMMQNLQRNC